MWRRRLGVLVVVVGAGLVVPSASAGTRDPEIKESPRPTRSQSVAPAAESVVVKLAEGASTSAVTRRGASVAGAVAGTGFVRVRPAGDPGELVAALRSDPSVVAADLDYPRRASAIPNDELYADFQQQYMNTVRLPEAWAQRTDASSQVIAIVDTGVDATHPDLAGRVVGGYNAVDPGTLPADEIGHGTAVAGVAAANTNNGIGMAGAAWNGRIMPVQVFTDIGGGEFVAFDSDTAEGIVWAVDHGAKIVNLSLGGEGYSSLLHAAVQYATDRGVVVVAASGNAGNDVPQYPAALPEVLAVGATDHNGALVDFSSYGDWLDLAAPGFGVVGTEGGTYFFEYGTSFSAPLVSGVAALVRAQNPSLTGAQVADRLRAAARDAGPRGIDPYYGYGVLDAARALGASFAPDLPFPALGAGEPNDVPAGATPIFTNATGSLAVEGDVDWYRYDLASTREVMVTSGVPAPFNPVWGQNIDPILEVYNASLKQIAAADNNAAGGTETVIITLEAGSYYFKLRNYNGAADPRSLTISVTPGEAVLRPPFTATPVGGWENNVAIGDVTGDGRNDVVLSTINESDPPNDHKLFVFAQQASGALAAPVRYTPVQPTISGFGLVDVDRDGREDVVVGGSTGLEVFRQTVTGQLTADGALPGLAGFVYLVVPADLDDDGDVDLVATGNFGIVTLTHGTGSSFTASSVTTDSTAVPMSTKVGDVDGDGRADIATTVGSRVRVYHDTGSGWTWTDHESVPGQIHVNLTGIEIADVTADGRADIVTTNRDAAVLNVFRQDSGGSLTPVQYGLGSFPRPVEAADMDGDDRTDVLTANAGGQDLNLLLQLPDGTLAPRVNVRLPFNLNQPSLQGLALGDVDSDGRNEAVLADRQHGLIVLHDLTVTPAGGAQELVRSVSPMEYSTGAGLLAAPQVEFAVDVDPSTLTGAVRLVDSRTGTTVPSSVGYDPGTKKATITPSDPLHDNKPYRIVVDGVEDADGNVQPWPFTSTFTTADGAPLLALSAFTAGGYGTSVRMSWVVPGGDLDVVMVRMAQGTAPPALSTAGTAAYTGIDSTVTIGGLITGTTYSFSVWWRDRSGAVSVTPRTATLFGNTLTIATTSSTSVQTGSTLNFTGTLTRVNPSGPLAGQQVALMTSCRGAEKDAVVGTAVSTVSGGLSVGVVQVMPACSYWWELAGAATFMGATSTRVQVNAIIPTPPGGTRER